MGEHDGPCRLSSALSYAVSEWLLMLLLFIDGLFSYMVTKFAKYCNLQTPCLFCSRLDHILGSKDSGFYKNLICCSHKLEISSLAYCHIHHKLADVRELCETCLLSFATEKKTNSETYRSLVGNLEIYLDSEKSIHPKPSEIGPTNEVCIEDVAEISLHSDLALGFLQKRCSCCKNRFRIKSHAHKLLQTKSIGVEIVEPSGALLGLTDPDYHPEPPNPGKQWELRWKPHMVSHGENCNSDPLSHFGYTKLKITSDSESEVPVSDDDDVNAIIHGSNDAKKDYASQSTQTDFDTSDAKILSKSPSGNVALEKLVHTPPIVTVSTVVPEKQIPASEPSDVVALSYSVGYESEECNRNEVQADEPSSRSDIVPNQASAKVVDSKDVEIAGVSSASSNIVDEEPKPLNLVKILSKPGQITSDPPLTMSGILDLNDTYKLVIGNKGNEASPRDPSRAQEDLRLLLSQFSSARGLDYPWNDTTPSPRVYGVGEEMKALDGSSPSGLQIITRRFSIERNESGLSSLDGSAFSEIEGESAVDRLKRLVEFEKRSLILLYRELEEERSASAIAANQAMAMITRLQEEKAAIHMEALQYQRMVEEQAEYDHEALQKSNELLSEREKELRDLKLEIAEYRKQFMDVYKGSDALSSLDIQEEKESSSISRQHGRLSVGVNNSSQIGMDVSNLEEEREETSKVFLLDFEKERIYISKCLKKLEKRLHLFSNNGIYTTKLTSDSQENDMLELSIENGQIDEKALGKIEIQSHHLDMIPENSQMEKYSISARRDSCPSRQTTKPSLSIDAENHEDYPSLSSAFKSKELDQHCVAIDRKNNNPTIETEISQLSERLKALEADRNFIEHAINSLRNGNEGLQFVQEIACHLQELRKFRMRRREEPTT